MNPAYDQYQPQRDALERETNKSVIPCFNTKVYAKTKSERVELNKAKAHYKALKENKGAFISSRDVIIEGIVKGKTPNWGGITIGITAL